MFGSNSYLGLTNHPEIIKAAKDHGIPIRIGVNAGSLEPGLPRTPEGVIESAIRWVSFAEEMDFHNIVISAKMSDPMATVKAYRLLCERRRLARLDARQFGADSRPKDIEHDFGGYIGGPAKLPGIWSSLFKTYFYLNIEKFKITGGVNRPTLSIPSMLERNGNFTDWTDSSGAIIPVYDPATTVIEGGKVSRQPFPGNIIPHDRFANSLALAWFKYLPEPNKPGALNNYLVPQPVPDTILGDPRIIKK